MGPRPPPHSRVNRRVLIVLLKGQVGGAVDVETADRTLYP